ncbi:hypothetical protein FA743_11880 [Paracoccus gahaiensis]|uniref:Uncharacterized protein n=1 Tax=Paracoccus gahaiensis TaxID=1706839 RepID=A0A4U0R7Z9_9RHOB|nr:hypothetical protein [Paracoccus gahaiensis]TJZ91221.1 hypothetical protein FA743_11880 [Paracoccus gahaiensis]
MRGLVTLVVAVLAAGGWAGWLRGTGHLHPGLAGQISCLHGHVALPLGAAWPMDQSWEAMAPSLG